MDLDERDLLQAYQRNEALSPEEIMQLVQELREQVAAAEEARREGIDEEMWDDTVRETNALLAQLEEEYPHQVRRALAGAFEEKEERVLEETDDSRLQRLWRLYQLIPVHLDPEQITDLIGLLERGVVRLSQEIMDADEEDEDEDVVEEKEDTLRRMRVTLTALEREYPDLYRARRVRPVRSRQAFASAIEDEAERMREEKEISIDRLWSQYQEGKISPEGVERLASLVGKEMERLSSEMYQAEVDGIEVTSLRSRQTEVEEMLMRLDKDHPGLFERVENEEVLVREKKWKGMCARILKGVNSEFDLDVLDSLLKKHSALVAGSYLVMHALDASESSAWAHADVDLWIHKNSHPKEFLIGLVSELGVDFPTQIQMRGNTTGYERLYAHIHRIYKTTTEGGRKVQIIVTHLPPPIVVGQFDLTVCRIALGGDQNILTHNLGQERWMSDLESMTLRTDHHVKQSTLEWIRTLHRVAKYYARGFKFETKNFLQEISQTLVEVQFPPQTIEHTWNQAISRVQLPRETITEFVMALKDNLLSFKTENAELVKNWIKMTKAARRDCKKAVREWVKLGWRKVVRYFRAIGILPEEEQLRIMQDYNAAVNPTGENVFVLLFYDSGNKIEFKNNNESLVTVWRSGQPYAPRLIVDPTPELRGESTYQGEDFEDTEVVYEKCFDFIAYEEINDFMPHLRESQSVGLIIGQKVYCLGVEQFQNIFEEQAGLFTRDQDVMVECIVDPEDARRKKVLMKDKYVQVRLEAIFLVPLVDVEQLLDVYRLGLTRLFQIKSTGKKLEYTASLGAATHLSNELMRQTRYRQVESSWVSADHCQTGSEKMLYRLVPTRNRQ